MGGVIYMKEKIIAFVKKETVLVVAAVSYTHLTLPTT